MQKNFSFFHFTITELLTVIGAVCIVITLLLPVIANRITRARLIACSNQQHTIGQAITFYAHDHAGFIPNIMPGAESGSVNILRMSDGRLLALGRLLNGYVDHPEVFGCPDSPGMDDNSVKTAWNSGNIVWSSYLYRSRDNGFNPVLQEADNINKAMLIDLAVLQSGQLGFAPHQYLFSNILFSDCHVESRRNSRTPEEFYTLNSIRPGKITIAGTPIWTKADQPEKTPTY